MPRINSAPILLTSAVLAAILSLCGTAAGAPMQHAPIPPWVLQMEAWPGAQPNPASHSGPMLKQVARDEIKSMLSRMNASGQRLYAAHAGSKTQIIQQKIIRSLNALIAAAEQSQSGPSSGKKKKQQKESSSMSMSQTGSQPGTPPNSPSHAAHRSHLTPGEGLRPGTMNAFHTRKQQWGNLPPRARNLILNALHHEPLPQYRQLVNQYYERLGKLGTPHHH